MTDSTYVRTAVLKKMNQPVRFDWIQSLFGMSLVKLFYPLYILTVLPKYLRTNFSPARRIFSSTKLKTARPPGNESVWTDSSGQFHSKRKSLCGISQTIQQKPDRGSMDSVKLTHCRLIELSAKLLVLFKILRLCFDYV